MPRIPYIPYVLSDSSFMYISRDSLVEWLRTPTRFQRSAFKFIATFICIKAFN